MLYHGYEVNVRSQQTVCSRSLGNSAWQIMYCLSSICLLFGLFLSTGTGMTPSPRPLPSASSKGPVSRDFVVQFYEKRISMQKLLIKLNMTRFRFWLDNLCTPPSCKYICPLNDSSDTRERMSRKLCYCDKLCLELGDCCFDYFEWCAADLTHRRQHSRHICVKTNNTDLYGYTMIGSCPSDNSEKRLETLCTATSSSFELPVFDLDDKSAYKNIFCAKRNHAGQTSRSARSRSSKVALIKYHIYAWTIPAIIVITSFALDTFGVVFIGYGDTVCWISNGKALLLILGVPVAFILAFNCAAIFVTLFSIWKTQKSTRRVSDQRRSLPILYLKLSSVMGLTWMLGFIVPFAKVEVLAYLFVICNSLQGFFITLAFLANKRTFNKVRNVWKSLSRTDGSTNTTAATARRQPLSTDRSEQIAVTTAF